MSCNEVILWAAFPSVLGGYFQLEFHITLSVIEIIYDVSGMQMELFFDFDFRRENREEGVGSSPGVQDCGNKGLGKALVKGMG